MAATVDGIFNSYRQLSLDSLVILPPPSPVLAALVAAATLSSTVTTTPTENSRFSTDFHHPSRSDAPRRQASRDASLNSSAELWPHSGAMVMMQMRNAVAVIIDSARKMTIVVDVF
ncbi:hypothetical protein ACS0TY_034571 [Phlomoides rotata]